MKRMMLISMAAGLAGMGFAAVASASPAAMSALTAGKPVTVGEPVAEQIRYKCRWVKKCWVGHWGHYRCRWVRHCYHW